MVGIVWRKEILCTNSQSYFIPLFIIYLFKDLLVALFNFLFMKIAEYYI